ncbi:YciI family protein [Pseudomonas viridiflava]|uniref:YciI family protein n=1 Tax=Pseudomonas viridiflava TaxID=33069 RepID=UPI0013032576|nr:YciI family protein [Pseudomonas viridiflava]
MKFYLCKYLPPRADFLATMTDIERALMAQHGAYLNELLDKDVIVAHGPVMDEQGGYGVSLCQIDDDQEVDNFTSHDPLVRQGVGHYEHYPMLHLKARG